MFDLVTLLRDAAYLAFEDGTNDYTTAPKAAKTLEAQADRIAKLEKSLLDLSFAAFARENQSDPAGVMEARWRLDEARQRADILLKEKRNESQDD